MSFLMSAIYVILLCAIVVKCSRPAGYHERHSVDGSQRTGGNGNNRLRRSVDSSVAGLNSRCLCPWRWVYDTDDTNSRVPPTIRYAKCLSRHCKTRPLQLDYVRKRRINRLTACVPTTTDFVIYVNGQQQVKTDMPVGCTCTYRHGVHTSYHPTSEEVNQTKDDYEDYDEGTQEEQHEKMPESSGSVRVSSADAHRRTRPRNNEQAYQQQWQALNVERFSDYINRQRTTNRS